MKFYLVCSNSKVWLITILNCTSKNLSPPVSNTCHWRADNRKLRSPGGVSISVEYKAPPVAVAGTHRETGWSDHPGVCWFLIFKNAVAPSLSYSWNKMRNCNFGSVVGVHWHASWYLSDNRLSTLVGTIHKGKIYQPGYTVWLSWIAPHHWQPTLHLG